MRFGYLSHCNESVGKMGKYSRKNKESGRWRKPAPRKKHKHSRATPLQTQREMADDSSEENACMWVWNLATVASQRSGYAKEQRARNRTSKRKKGRKEVRAKWWIIFQEPNISAFVDGPCFSTHFAIFCFGSHNFKVCLLSDTEKK